LEEINQLEAKGIYTYYISVHDIVRSFKLRSI